MKTFFKGIARFANWLVIAALLLSYLSPFISPNTFWPISFFGLTHVVWVILGFVFLFLSLVYKLKTLRYNLAVILIGIPFLLRVISFNGATTPPQDQIRMASFNTYALGVVQKLNTRSEIEHFLDTADVTCAALIEWRFHKGGISKKHFPYQVRLHHKTNPDNGILMVSRFPIKNSGMVKFRSPSYNMAGFMDVEINNQVVRVYGLHLETTRLKPRHYHALKSLNFDDVYAENAKNIAQRLKFSMQKRANQVDDLVKHIHECSYPSIVMGDFNDGSQSYTYQMLKSGKKDAFVEAGRGFESTFLRPFPLLRIDFMLYDEEFECLQYQSTKAIYSDHKLIFADFNLKKNNGLPRP